MRASRERNPGRPMVLLGHLDVVPAHDEGWVAPPFGGVVKDGFIYGRGAIDMKSQIACHLLSFIDLKRSGIIPERDLIFSQPPTRRRAGPSGWSICSRRSRICVSRPSSSARADSSWKKGGSLHARVSVGEKQVCWFRMQARGRGGHGSMPHDDNANDKIVRAAHEDHLGETPLEGHAHRDEILERPLQGEAVREHDLLVFEGGAEEQGLPGLAENDPALNSLLTNSVALTMLQSGDKVNVIPPESTAYFDARILPDVKHEAFLDRMRKTAGPEVEITLVSRSDSVPSPYNTPYFRGIAKAVRCLSGPIPVLALHDHGRDRPAPLQEPGHPRLRPFSARLVRRRAYAHARGERAAVSQSPG